MIPGVRSAMSKCRMVEELEVRARQTGRTSMLLKARQALAARLVVSTLAVAEDVQGMAASKGNHVSRDKIVVLAAEPAQMAGLRGPVLYDDSAVSDLAHACLQALRRQAEEITRLEERVADLRAWLIRRDAQIKDHKQRIQKLEGLVEELTGLLEGVFEMDDDAA